VVSPLLILTGVELEARVLARALELPRVPTFPFPVFGRPSIRIAPVGVGAHLCGSRWAALLDGLPHPLVVSAGVCGGLDPRLGPADLVIPERVLGPTGELRAVASATHRAAVARAGGTACAGLLVTTREVVATPAAKAALHAASGAVAADMESVFILARAAEFGCPALVVRAVSDSADECLSLELARLVTLAGGLRLTRALALMSTRPVLVARAIALGRRTHRALRAVAPALAALAA
jgi:adenosylhomocysteine nucleosidase